MSTATHTIRNGVDTEKLFATLDLIKAQPELARFQFRATNRWINGALRMDRETAMDGLQIGLGAFAAWHLLAPRGRRTPRRLRARLPVPFLSGRDASRRELGSTRPTAVRSPSRIFGSATELPLRTLPMRRRASPPSIRTRTVRKPRCCSWPPWPTSGSRA